MVRCLAAFYFLSSHPTPHWHLAWALHLTQYCALINIASDSISFCDHHPVSLNILLWENKADNDRERKKERKKEREREANRERGLQSPTITWHLASTFHLTQIMMVGDWFNPPVPVGHSRRIPQAEYCWTSPLYQNVHCWLVAYSTAGKPLSHCTNCLWRCWCHLSVACTLNRTDGVLLVHWRRCCWCTCKSLLSSHLSQQLSCQGFHSYLICTNQTTWEFNMR